MSAQRTAIPGSQGEQGPPPAPADFDAVFQKYSPYVARVAMRLLVDPDDADDIVQEVFMMALRGLQTVKEPSAVPSWLATLTVRLVHRKLQRRKLSALFGRGRSFDAETIISPVCPPEDRVVLRRIYVALDRVSAVERIAWGLRYLEGETVDAVAKACRCSVSTVKRRIAAAQKVVDEVLHDA